ncbi:hypothetical protein PAMP_013061 [Pampus punctatissimus]
MPTFILIEQESSFYCWGTECVCVSYLRVNPVYPRTNSGEKKLAGTMWNFSITLIHKFMSCHRCLLLSLTTPPPFPSPPQPFPPQAAQAYPFAALSPLLQQPGAAASQRCGVLHACPVFLLAPLLAARRWRRCSLL